MAVSPRVISAVGCFSVKFNILKMSAKHFFLQQLFDGLPINVRATFAAHRTLDRTADCRVVNINLGVAFRALRPFRLLWVLIDAEKRNFFFRIPINGVLKFRAVSHRPENNFDSVRVKAFQDFDGVRHIVANVRVFVRNNRSVKVNCNNFIHNFYFTRLPAKCVNHNTANKLLNARREQQFSYHGTCEPVARRLPVPAHINAAVRLFFVI